MRECIMEQGWGSSSIVLSSQFRAPDCLLFRHQCLETNRVIDCQMTCLSHLFFDTSWHCCVIICLDLKFLTNAISCFMSSSGFAKCSGNFPHSTRISKEPVCILVTRTSVTLSSSVERMFDYCGPEVENFCARKIKVQKIKWAETWVRREELRRLTLGCRANPHREMETTWAAKVLQKVFVVSSRTPRVADSSLVGSDDNKEARWFEKYSFGELQYLSTSNCGHITNNHILFRAFFHVRAWCWGSVRFHPHHPSELWPQLSYPQNRIQDGYCTIHVTYICHFTHMQDCETSLYSTMVRFMKLSPSSGQGWVARGVSNSTVTKICSNEDIWIFYGPNLASFFLFYLLETLWFLFCSVLFSCMSVGFPVGRLKACKSEICLKTTHQKRSSERKRERMKERKKRNDWKEKEKKKTRERKKETQPHLHGFGREFLCRQHCVCSRSSFFLPKWNHYQGEHKRFYRSPINNFTTSTGTRRRESLCLRCDLWSLVFLS